MRDELDIFNMPKSISPADLKSVGIRECLYNESKEAVLKALVFHAGALQDITIKYWEALDTIEKYKKALDENEILKAQLEKSIQHRNDALRLKLINQLDGSIKKYCDHELEQIEKNFRK